MLRRETKYKPNLVPSAVSVPYNPSTGRTGPPVTSMGVTRESATNTEDMAAGLPWTKGADPAGAQDEQPQPLKLLVPANGRSGSLRPDDARDYWLFRGSVYSSIKGQLTIDDVGSVLKYARGNWRIKDLASDQAAPMVRQATPMVRQAAPMVRATDLHQTFDIQAILREVVPRLEPRPAKPTPSHFGHEALASETRFIPRVTRERVSVPYFVGLGGMGDLVGEMSWALDSPIAMQNNAPQPLDPPVRVTGSGSTFRRRVDEGRDYWLFRGEVYSTQRGVCSSDDVKALALEGENKTKAKLARAHALIAQVDALERGGRQPIPDESKMFVWQRDGGKCVRCGSNVHLEFDHIIPVSMGGANTARNLQLLCEGCNRAKGGSLA